METRMNVYLMVSPNVDRPEEEYDIPPHIWDHFVFPDESFLRHGENIVTADVGFFHCDKACEDDQDIQKDYAGKEGREENSR